MFYVYILQSQKDGNLYIGRTNDLDRRLKEHQNGRVSSTKSRRPFVMRRYFSVANESDSVILEKELKKGFRRDELKKSLNTGGFA